MMIDATFKFTLTIYHKVVSLVNGRNVTSWQKAVVDNCFFSAVKGESINNGVIGMADSYVARIPPNLPFKPCVGDIVIKGNVADVIADTAGQRPENILQKYKGDAFTVKSLSDNTLFEFAPHWRLSGV